jgi:glycine/D-amino acid oxidase-like deaminating enzyme
MDLIGGYPYNLVKHGLIQTYPPLLHDIKTDVLVVGAGLSGAMIGYQLVKSGFDVTFIDKRHAAGGSTLANTSLLQYEPDLPLHQLVKMIGRRNAFDAYRLCRDSVIQFRELVEPIDNDLFQSRPSYYFASRKYDAAQLQREFELRVEAGLEVDYVSREDVTKSFGIKSHGALRTAIGGQTNAFLVTHVLLEESIRLGANVFSKTVALSYDYGKRNVNIKTDRHHNIRARYLVFANGYEAVEMIDKQLANIRVTYASIGEPLHDKTTWYEDALLWETRRPYNYLRIVDGNRYLIGGCDVDYNENALSSKQVATKSFALQKDFKRWFPTLQFKPDFTWCGAFAETHDSLPYIGSVKKFPRSCFSLGYGGNGILFTVIAANAITQMIQGKKYRYEKLFGFSR